MRQEEMESLDSPSCSIFAPIDRLVSRAARFLPVSREENDLISLIDLLPAWNINLADINCDEDMKY